MNKVYVLKFFQDPFDYYSNIELDIIMMDDQEYDFIFIGNFDYMDFDYKNDFSFQHFRTYKEALKVISTHLKDSSKFSEYGLKNLRKFIPELKKEYPEYLI